MGTRPSSHVGWNGDGGGCADSRISEEEKELEILVQKHPMPRDLEGSELKAFNQSVNFDTFRALVPRLSIARASRFPHRMNFVPTPAPTSVVVITKGMYCCESPEPFGCTRGFTVFWASSL